MAAIFTRQKTITVEFLGRTVGHSYIPGMSANHSDPIRYRGYVAYMFAFDLAYELKDAASISTLLGQPMAEYAVDQSKRSPRHLFFYRPRVVRLPPAERIGPGGLVRVETTVKLLTVGAVTITVRVPFETDSISELVAYHDIQFTNGSLQTDVRSLALRIRDELAPYLVRPIAQVIEEEAFTVFCFNGPLQSGTGENLNAEAWLKSHRREVAGLLTQEDDSSELSDQEAEESTQHWLSYYGDDIVVMDWDAALLIDAPSDFEEALYVMELANLQLAELEAYDRLLDDALQSAYRDLRNRALRRKTEVLADLRDLRIDLARMNDEMSNITKFFGDWHLARIYSIMAGRFHLAEWRKNVDEKLRTLNDLYQLLAGDQNNRMMLILEITIVVLFVIDLVILVLGLKH